MEPPHSRSKRDPLFIVILAAIGAVVLWLLLTPLVPAIARVTMRRFHLASESFAGWAIQAPIPTMYNFGNQYEIRELPENLITPILDSTRPRYINHFPTRVLTFANGRYTLLHPQQDRWLTFRSSYRGQTLETKVHAQPLGGGRFRWVRLSSKFLPAAAGEAGR
jgi:hypothetical protein